MGLNSLWFPTSLERAIDEDWEERKKKRQKSRPQPLTKEERAKLRRQSVDAERVAVAKREREIKKFDSPRAYTKSAMITDVLMNHYRVKE